MDTQNTREDYFKVHGVVCHCFSPNASHVAVSIRSLFRIDIYRVVDLTRVNTWELVAQLSDSHQQVSGLDWSVKDALLMASHDRSVMVYLPQTPGRYDSWQHQLAVVPNSRAALNAKWNHTGQKFVIGTGDHKAYIGYYEPENQWWNAKDIRVSKSSVVATAFHPSGRVVAVGSTDFSLNLVTCAIVDENENYIAEHDDQNYSGPFAAVKTFGDVILSLKDTGGWVESVAFSPNAQQLLLAVHNGTLSTWVIGDNDEFHPAKESLTVPSLPVKTIIFKSDTEAIVAGYDGRPFVVSIDSAGNLAFASTCDKLLTVVVTKTGGKVQEVRNRMQNNQQKTSTGPKTADLCKVFADKPGHETPITCLRALPSLTPSQTFRFTTSDSTGRIYAWEQ